MGLEGIGYVKMIFQPGGGTNLCINQKPTMASGVKVRISKKKVSKSSSRKKVKKIFCSEYNLFPPEHTKVYRVPPPTRGCLLSSVRGFCDVLLKKTVNTRETEHYSLRRNVLRCTKGKTESKSQKYIQTVERNVDYSLL